MTVKEKIINVIMDKVSEVSLEIRLIEEASKKYKVASNSNPAYIGHVAYKQALTELLDAIRGIDDNVKSGRNI